MLSVRTGKNMIPDSRLCACQCGKLIIRKSYEHDLGWQRNRYFSHSCWNRGKRRKKQQGVSGKTRRDLANTKQWQAWLCGQMK